MEENLEKIEKFFKYNLKIKQILADCQPPINYAASRSNNIFNIDYTIVQFAKKMYQSLEDIEFYITRILEMFEYKAEDKKYVKELFHAYKKKLIISRYNFDKLKRVHKVVFYNMREELVEEVGRKCVGYYLFKGVSLKKAESINELLHVIHATITNNESLYQTMPKLKEKINNFNYPITLYGKEYDLAREIYNKYPLELDCGNVDILSLKNNKKVLMMIRDRGHALSIELEESNNKVFVNYFIPKICNVEMVNNLKDNYI